MEIEQFHNLEEIKTEFFIEETNLKEIRKVLIKLLAEVYPLDPSGKFDTKEKEIRYYRISNAIEFVDNAIDISQALVPIHTLPEIIKSIQDISLSTNQPSPDYTTKLDHQIDKSYKEYKSKIFIPKISLTALSAILTFIWLFPTALEGNPIFKNFTDTQNSLYYNFFSLFYFLILFFTFCIWFIFSIRELRRKEFYSRVKSETFQNYLFSEFIESRRVMESKMFLKSDLKNFIARGYFGILENDIHNEFRRSAIAYYFGRDDPIDDELGESIADLIIAKGLEKGILERKRGKLLEDVYTLKE